MSVELGSVLVTGGTGSFGQAFVRRVLEMRCANCGFPEIDDVTCHRCEGKIPERVIVFSRDELKQHEMRQLPEFQDERLRFFLGDVRDLSRLRRAFAGVDVVVHAAAMKQVPACEFNPSEAIATNVIGSRNVADAALDCGVGRVISLGTDKAVDPVNLYGATKLAAEKYMVHANSYSGDSGPMFSCTRYGNVLSSRGSVLPLWISAADRGKKLRITDSHMTRFVLTLEQGVDFVLSSLGEMVGGEVFVPKLPAVDLITMSYAVTHPQSPRLEFIDPRPGEKRHELLISENELREDRGWCFVVGRGELGPAVSSASAERLDVAGFRALAGLGGTLEEAAS